MPLEYSAFEDKNNSSAFLQVCTLGWLQLGAAIFTIAVSGGMHLPLLNLALLTDSRPFVVILSMYYLGTDFIAISAHGLISHF